MKQYELLHCKQSEFDCLLICLSPESIHNYLDSLCNNNFIKTSKGKIIIDQLLLTGNEYNRFISFNFDHGIIDFNSSTYNSPKDKIRAMSLSVLRKNISELKYSILTDNQVSCILNNQIF